MNDTKFTSATAGEAGRRSVEVRRRKAQLSPEERASEAARKAAPQLIDELLAAAQGTGDFKDLKPDDRLRALFRALEYAVGRPELRTRIAPDVQNIPTADELFGD